MTGFVRWLVASTARNLARSGLPGKNCIEYVLIVHLTFFESSDHPVEQRKDALRMIFGYVIDFLGHSS